MGNKEKLSFIQQFLFFFTMFFLMQIGLDYFGLTTFSSRHSSQPLNALDSPPVEDLIEEQSHHEYYTWSTEESALVFDKISGDIVELELKNYSVSKNNNQKIRTLFGHSAGKQKFVEGVLCWDSANNVAIKPLPQNVSFELNKENNILIIKKHYPNNLVLQTEYSAQEPYTYDRKVSCISQSENPIKVAFYTELRNTNQALIEGTEKGSRMFQGASVHTEKTRYKKIPFTSFAKEQSFQELSSAGWYSFSQRYFATALKNLYPSKYYLKYLQSDKEGQKTYVIGSVSDLVTVAPAQQLVFNSQFYSGPEDKNLLTAFDPAFSYVIDFGFFWPICNALLGGLSFFYKVLGDWGFAIIALTLCIRGAIFAISWPHQETLKKLQRLGPQQEKLRKEISDSLAYNQAVLDLHRREKVSYLSVLMVTVLNPLIQIPVLFGFYSLLMESIVLRQSVFLNFVQDLSLPDPSYVLPVLLLVSGLLQQKLTSQKMQNSELATMMKVMPFIFAALSLTFPSGLVLYWVINNTFSLCQEGLSKFVYGTPTQTR